LKKAKEIHHRGHRVHGEAEVAGGIHWHGKWRAGMNEAGGWTITTHGSTGLLTRQGLLSYGIVRMTSDRVPGVGLELQQKMEIGVTRSRIRSNVLGKSRELQIRANDNAETQRSRRMLAFSRLRLTRGALCGCRCHRRSRLGRTGSRSCTRLRCCESRRSRGCF
jgi:hypothetical protein